MERSATRAPHPALAGLVGGYHGYLLTDLPASVHHGLPSRELTVVIAFDDPIEVGWLDRDDTRERYWVVTSGLSTAPAGIVQHGHQFGIQLGLTPLGARVLLGLPAGALADTMVPLEEIAGPLQRRLYDAVAGAGGDWEPRFRALDRELLRMRAARDGEDASPGPELRLAWRWLGRDIGAGTVGRLADEVGWSRRHLADRFRSEYGVTPKEAARIARFERSRGLLLRSVTGERTRSPNALPGTPRRRPGLAEIAATCGYADQAHLTREWRAMAGYSPTEWLREEIPFVQDSGDHG